MPSNPSPVDRWHRPKSHAPLPLLLAATRFPGADRLTQHLSRLRRPRERHLNMPAHAKYQGRHDVLGVLGGGRSGPPGGRPSGSAPRTAPAGSCARAGANLSSTRRGIFKKKILQEKGFFSPDPTKTPGAKAPRSCRVGRAGSLRGRTRGRRLRLAPLLRGAGPLPLELELRARGGAVELQRGCAPPPGTQSQHAGSYNAPGVGC